MSNEDFNTYISMQNDFHDLIVNYLEMAIKMELDGENFYKEQAAKNKDNASLYVFIFLAEEEQKHKEALEELSNALALKQPPSIELEKLNNPFQGLQDFKTKIKDIPEQLDIYRLALKMEQESIDFYQDISTKIIEPEAKKVINALIEFEKKHYQIFEEIINHLLHADEWVEDAEFGLRKPY